MTTVFIFITGHSLLPGPEGESLYTACALTDAGKWLAGAVSRQEKVALTRCRDMAVRKAPSMLSGNIDVVISDIRNRKVLRALDLAFANMP